MMRHRNLARAAPQAQTEGFDGRSGGHPFPVRCGGVKTPPYRVAERGNYPPETRPAPTPAGIL